MPLNTQNSTLNTQNSTLKTPSLPLPIHILFWCVIIGLFVLCYHSTLSWMYGRWEGIDSYYSHGFLIPLVTGFLIWRKRGELKTIQVSGSWIGLGIIIFAALLHIFGTVLYVFSISGFSIFFLVLGTVLFLFGKEITRKLAFPLLYLIFMFPLPLAVLTAISFPFKIMAAKAGVTAVRLLGVPVIRQGFDITIPAGSMVVGNPCSGLRSLIAFLALGAILAYFTEVSSKRKIVLFFLSIPIAILSNAVRVPILILISHFYGIEAASPDTIWHVGTGMAVFVLGFILLMTAGKILQWKT